MSNMNTALAILKILDETQERLDYISIREQPMKFAIVTGSMLQAIREECEAALPGTPEELNEVFPPERPQLADDYWDSFDCQEHCDEQEDDYE